MFDVVLVRSVCVGVGGGESVVSLAEVNGVIAGGGDVVITSISKDAVFTGTAIDGVITITTDEDVVTIQAFDGVVTAFAVE